MSTRSPFAVLALVLAAALSFPDRAAAQDETREALLDPLPIRDQFLLANGFFFFEPGGARVLPDARWTLTVHNTDANTFAKSAWISRSLEFESERRTAAEQLARPRFASRDTLFLVDGQTHRTTFVAKRGVGNHVEVGIAVPVLRIGGGWSDRVIETVHHALHTGNAERDTFAQNGETVFLRTPTTQYERSRGNGFALGDVALTAKWELTPLEDRRFAMAIEGAVELPTGNAATLDGSGSFDGGVQFVATRLYSDRTRLHVSFAATRLGANRPLGTAPQVVLSDTVALTHLVSPVTSSVVQITVSESPFRAIGIGEFEGRSYQLATGLQHRVGANTIVNVAFIENLLNYNNSADAGLAWGITYRY